MLQHVLHRGKHQSKLGEIWNWEHGGKAGALKGLTPSCFLFVTKPGRHKVLLYFFVKLGGRREKIIRVDGLQPFL